MIHRVKPGEHLANISQHYGFADWHPIWDHPQNADLKEHRQDPNVLFPGDKLFIPEKELKSEDVPTEQRHRFRLNVEPLMLRIVVKDINDQPIPNTNCLLRINLDEFELTTDAEGMIEQKIQNTDETGLLIMPECHLKIPIKIGHLDPVETPSGQLARLQNLGFFTGSIEDVDEIQLLLAVEEFQCEHGLVVDGDCGPSTQSKLKEVYGC